MAENINNDIASESLFASEADIDSSRSTHIDIDVGSVPPPIAPAWLDSVVKSVSESVSSSIASQVMPRIMALEEQVSSGTSSSSSSSSKLISDMLSKINAVTGQGVSQTVQSQSGCSSGNTPVKSKVVVPPNSSLKKRPSVSSRLESGTISRQPRTNHAPAQTDSDADTESDNSDDDESADDDDRVSIHAPADPGLDPTEVFTLGSNCKQSCNPKSGLSSKTSIWEDLEGDYVAEIATGSPVQDSIASATKHLFSSKPVGDKLVKVLDRTRIPSNCTFLIPKRVNPEIWAISPIQRSHDIKLQAISTAIAKSQAKTLEITNRLFELDGSTLQFTPSQREFLEGITKDLGMVTQLNGVAAVDLNQYRRENFKRCLKSEVQRLAVDVDETEADLFGSDLAKRTSEALASSKLAKELKAGDLREKLSNQKSVQEKRTFTQRNQSNSKNSKSPQKGHNSRQGGNKGKSRGKKKSQKK